MDITKSYSDVRKFGPNRGIPMRHLEVNGNKGNTNDILKDIVDTNFKLDWIFIKGDNVQGLGTFLKGLAQFRVNIEVQLETLDPAPGWIVGPNNILLPYKAESRFNYFTLRPEKDFILFKASTTEELEELFPVFYELRFTPAIKWLLVSEDIYWSAYDLVIQYPRSRMSIKEGNHHVKVNSTALEVNS